MRNMSNMRPCGSVLLPTKHLKLKARPGKLQTQYIGPFKVLKMTGHKAANLELLPAIKVHPVINVA